SAGLTFFNRHALSTADVLAGRTQAGLPYFGRSETVTNTGTILAGRNQPGSSMPLNDFTPPIRNYPLSPANPPIVPDRNLALRGPPVAPETMLPQQPLTPGMIPPESAAPPAMQSPFNWAVRSPLFGTESADTG